MMSVNGFYIPVVDCCPPLNQESVGIVIAPGNVSQAAFRDQGAGSEGGGADNRLSAVAPESVRILPDAYLHAVHGDGLIDITGNKTGIKTVFFQVIISPFGAYIRQVQGFGDGGLYRLIIGVE